MVVNTNPYPIECPFNFSALFCGGVNWLRHCGSCPRSRCARSGRWALSWSLCREDCEGRCRRLRTASGWWGWWRISASIWRLGLRLIVVFAVSEEEEVLIFFILVVVRLETLVSFQSIIFLSREGRRLGLDPWRIPLRCLVLRP